MKDNIYEENDIIVRKATLDDDFERMAELIYETDDYIYPYWFNDDREKCKKELSKLMKEDDFFFNYKSMYIAVDKNTNEIVGLTCFVTPETNLEYDYEPLREKNERYKFIIDEYIYALINEIRDYNAPYISNVAVYHSQRGKRIGSIMLNAIMSEKKKEYRKILLDVLADNPSAIKLYENLGFRKTSDAKEDIGYGPNDLVYSYSMEFNEEADIDDEDGTGIKM